MLASKRAELKSPVLISDSRRAGHPLSPTPEKPGRQGSLSPRQLFDPERARFLWTQFSALDAPGLPLSPRHLHPGGRPRFLSLLSIPPPRSRRLHSFPHLPWPHSLSPHPGLRFSGPT